MGISSALGSSALLPAGLGFRNKIINGGFDIWQRGTSFTNPTAGGAFYTADRWGFNRFLDANGTTISRSTDAPTGQRYSLKWQRTAGDTGTGEMDGWYAVETADSIPLAGQQVVLSFWAKKGANYSGGALSSYVHSGTGTDQREYAFTGRTAVASGSHTLTTSWQLFTIYGVVPASATQVGLQFAWNPTGTAGADDSVYIDRVQLEANYQPTPFEQRPFGVELQLCQRYYEKSYRYGTAPGTATFDALITMAYSAAAGTSGELGGHVMMNTYKRIPPNITWYDHAGNINKCTRLQAGVANHANQSVVNGATGEHYLGVASVSGAASTCAIQLHFVAECEL